MSIRSIFATSSIVFLVVLAGCLGAAPTGAVVSTPAETTARTISVGGSGSATANPDLAIVRIAVVNDGETAATARDATVAAVQTLRSALRENAVTDEAVRTTYFRLEPIYDFGEDRRELVAFRASHGFEIEINPDRAGELIDIVVDNGASRVDGIEFTLTPTTRAELRTEAIRDALTHARADADTMAAATGVRITGLHSASTGSVSVVPFDVRTETIAEGTTIEPGPVAISATVQATYSIEG